MKQLRILHVNNIANVGSMLVEGLCALGHHASLLKLDLPGGSYPTFFKLFLIPARIRELALVNRRITSGHFDIVHIHYAYLGVLGIAERYPYFLHCHGTDVRAVKRDIMRWLPVKESIKRAKACFFSTPDLASVVRGIRPSAIFMPNPINTDKFKPSWNVVGSGPVRILIISSLSDLKGISIAFQAVKILHDANFRIKVSAFAAGPDRRKYLETSGIEFMPSVAHSEMPDVINAHDIVVGQFSAHGSFGMSELEVMACGKPVICYFNCAAWYPEPPPVLSANEPSQVAYHLSCLINDRGLGLELGRQGRDWVQRNHNHLEISRKLLEVYLMK